MLNAYFLYKIFGNVDNANSCATQYNSNNNNNDKLVCISVIIFSE